MPLIFTAQQGSRPDFFDRHPQTGLVWNAIANVAPHAFVTRATYTVGANRKAWLDSVWLHAYRSVVATAANVAQVFCIISPAAGGGAVYFYLYHNNNVLFSDRELVVAQGGFLGSGDAISFQTGDGSNAGAMSYDFAVKRTEYDA